MTHERFSACFFKQASKDRKLSHLSELRISENEVLTDRKEIQDHLLLQYFYLYQGEPMQTENLDFFLKYAPKLRKKENTSPFSFSEALGVFREMKPGTCPGPDGIPCEFYKKYFHVFGHFYVKMLNNSLRDKIVPTSWKTSILKVIPKIPDQIPSFDTLRPLTLSNVDCKNEAGMLVKRMTIVTDEVIHKLQTGGLPHRRIQESTFLIHLLINLYKENNWGGNIVALDNIKAFDRLIREFLWVVLETMGFDLWTIQAIKNLYSENYARIIINGFLSDPFPVESGVKQGCPLSSLLFAVAMEPLARSILEDPLYTGSGFMIPGSKEVRLIQHLDDMTLFCKNSHVIRDFMQRILQYTSLSGAKINYTKSFVIRLNSKKGILDLDEPKLCNIPVLGKKECRKILGIFYGSDINLYVKKNWSVVHDKCIDALKTWSICFSSDGFTSLMGRVLVVHVMVHSKLIYLMQSMQFFSESIDEINKAVQKFLWSGKKHIPIISLPVLEAPLKLGGIGIKPLDHRAISLRFPYIQNFFAREQENWIIDKSPAEAIMCYFLDLSVRNLAPDIPRIKMAPLSLAAKYHKPGSIKFIGHLPNIFDVLYWDIERAIGVIGSAENLENYNQRHYLEDLMERRTLHLREGSVNKAFISRYCYPLHMEDSLWRNLLLNLLDPKVKAFAYKLAHNCLPTKFDIWRKMRHFANSQGDPWCQCCRMALLTNFECTAKHIFMNCIIARNTWKNVNELFRTAGKPEYDISEKMIFFRFGLNRNHSYFVTEILWALWRVNNYNNYDILENESHKIWDHKKVLEIVNKRIKYTSKIDKEIYVNRGYRKRWDGINRVVGFVFDNG